MAPRLISAERFDKILKFKRSVVPVAVDEECRCAVNAAAHAADILDHVEVLQGADEESALPAAPTASGDGA